MPTSECVDDICHYAVLIGKCCTVILKYIPTWFFSDGWGHFSKNESVTVLHFTSSYIQFSLFLNAAFREGR